MSGVQADLQAIVERCIVENSDESWTCFLDEFGPLIRKVFHAHAATTDFADFEAWFPGWLFYERKLQSLYRGLQAKILCGECKTAAEENEYIANYIASVIRTAIAEFFRESRKNAPKQASDAVLSLLPEKSTVRKEFLPASVGIALLDMTRELRVPFWMRYYPALGPMPDEDVAWVADCSGLAAQDVVRLIESEVHANCERKKPLSSEFIGAMLNISPSADGKFSTVDQRVRRAILRLRQYHAELAKD